MSFYVLEQFYQSWFPSTFSSCSLDQTSSPGIYNTNSPVDVCPIIQGETSAGYVIMKEKNEDQDVGLE